MFLSFIHSPLSNIDSCIILELPSPCINILVEDKPYAPISYSMPKIWFFLTFSRSSSVSQSSIASVIALTRKAPEPQQGSSILEFLFTPTALHIKSHMWSGVNAWFLSDFPTYLLNVVKKRFNKSCPAVFLSLIYGTILSSIKLSISFSSLYVKLDISWSSNILLLNTDNLPALFKSPLFANNPDKISLMFLITTFSGDNSVPLSGSIVLLTFWYIRPFFKAKRHVPTNWLLNFSLLPSECSFSFRVLIESTTFILSFTLPKHSSSYSSKVLNFLSSVCLCSSSIITDWPYHTQTSSPSVSAKIATIFLSVYSFSYLT